MVENTVKKSNRYNGRMKRIPHWLIADVVGCAPSTVKAIRNGQRNINSKLGQRIVTAEIIIEDKLINEVKRLVQFQ